MMTFIPNMSQLIVGHWSNKLLFGTPMWRGFEKKPHQASACGVFFFRKPLPHKIDFHHGAFSLRNINKTPKQIAPSAHVEGGQPLAPAASGEGFWQGRVKHAPGGERF